MCYLLVIASTTRQRLIEAAAELWHVRSYHGVGVADICAAAEANKGSFFHFFQSKEDLLLVVLDHHAHCIRTRLDRVFADEIRPLDRIDGYLQSIAAVAREQCAVYGRICGCPIGNIAGELSTLSPMVQERTRKLFDGVRTAIRKALSDAVKTGDVQRDLDPHATAAALVAYTQGLALIGKTYGSLELLDQLLAKADSVAGIRRSYSI